MHEVNTKSGSRWILSLTLLLLLVVTLVTAGVAFAGLPSGSLSGLPAQGNIVTQGTPTATATITCTAAGAPGPWTVRANYPEPMAGLSVASDGTSIYGFLGRASGRRNVVYKYNYATDSWTSLASYPYGAGPGSQAEYGHNGKIYVVGGTSEAQSVTGIYDIASNSWTQGALVPAPVSNHGLAYWNGKVYVIGGGQYGAAGSGVYAYDIASDMWSTLAPLPQAERSMATDAINGKIYVANGDTGSGSLNNLYIYDIATNTWSDGPPSPRASTGPASTVLGGKLYMIGGNGGPPYSNTYLYDPATNSWSAGPSLNVARYNSAAAIINTPGGETAIVVGGFGNSLWLNSVEASTAPLVPCTPTATGTPPTNTPTRTRTPTPTSTPTPNPCGLAWRTVPSPNQGYELRSVAVVSAKDVWAVGYYFPTNYNAWTLTEHWDGTSWSIVPSPNPDLYSNLFGVAAASANDVWAVGSSENNSGVDHTLTEHWDGTQWNVVPSPNPGTVENDLWGVAVVAGNDVWAVGVGYLTSQSSQTLIEHWDGSSWSIVPSPSPGTGLNDLYGVTAVSANDVWAVGRYEVGNGGSYQTLTEHWNGTSWSVVPSPNPDTDGLLYGVAAVSGNDVWAVGSSDHFSTIGHTLTEHWDGISWSIVPSPDPGSAGNDLWGVAAVSGNDIWAVGEYHTANGGGTLTEHWNGSSWSIVPSPTGDGYLYGVGAVSGNDVWAAGIHYLNGSAQTLIEHYNDLCGTATVTPTGNTTNTPTQAPTRTNTSVPPTFTDTRVVPSGTAVPPSNTAPLPSSTVVPPTFTSTRVLPSATVAPPSSTAISTSISTSTRVTVTSTPTACAIRFADVPAGSPFYQWVQCLACRGIVSGYPCGGAGAPCNSTNDPYFRPGNLITRGQISKVVAISAGYTQPVPPGRQTFEDVPPASTFYLWIENLAERGIISGYPCGTLPEELCVAPNNLPYFRPNSNVTRGQAAKIVANTFFPGCSTPQRR